MVGPRSLIDKFHHPVTDSLQLLSHLIIGISRLSKDWTSSGRCIQDALAEQRTTVADTDFLNPSTASLVW